MNKLNNIEIGKKGENTAAKYLKRNKYKILQRNYNTKFGEIDIICKKDDYIIFVEVKTRKSDPLVRGVFAVDSKKQRHILKAASSYISSNNCSFQPRFDIIEVEYNGCKKFYVKEHIIGAFSQGGSYAAF